MYVELLTNINIMKYTAVIITLVMLPIIVQANKNMILAEKCESSFIWVEYDESLEKECRPMWDTMTKEIKKTAWIIPTTASSVTNESIEKAPSPTKSIQSVKKIENKIKPIWKIKPTTEKPISKTASPVKSSSIETKKPEQKIIYRHWWNDPRVQYAYNISGGDMDFIKTIEAESKWDLNALWDSGKSFWLCQIHKGYNPAMQKAYRALKTDNEKVKMCYDQYKDWVNRWVIKTRLYGYNVRNKPQNSKSFTIN